MDVLKKIEEETKKIEELNKKIQLAQNIIVQSREEGLKIMGKIELLNQQLEEQKGSDIDGNKKGLRQDNKRNTN